MSRLLRAWTKQAVLQAREERQVLRQTIGAVLRGQGARTCSSEHGPSDVSCNHGHTISSTLNSQGPHLKLQLLNNADLSKYENSTAFPRSANYSRLFSTSTVVSQQSSGTSDAEEANNEDDDEENELDSDDEFLKKFNDPKDRSRVISPELSMKYLESLAYQTTYGQEPVWKYYRRNYKGWRVPKTRETCIRLEKVTTGSPCPICRDQYLVIDYRNIKLLSQFIDSYSGAVIDPYTTGICQYQWRRLQLHIQKAKNHGLLDIDCDQITYDLSQYIPKHLQQSR